MKLEPTLQVRACIVLTCLLAAAGCDDPGGSEDAGRAARDAGPASADAGSPTGDAGSSEVDAGALDSGAPRLTECTTTLAAATAGDFVELCPIDGTVEHVRIEGFATAPPHGSAQIVFGFDAPPMDPQPTLEADQLQVLFYAGASPFPPPQAQVTFGAHGLVVDDPSFVLGPSTVCFDLHDGAADEPPYFALWVDGVRGADCAQPATLTVASAHAVGATWRGLTGAVDKTTSLYFRQSSGQTAEPVVTLFDDPVLDATVIAEAGRCVTAPAASGDWQPVCEPTVAATRHVRVEDVETSGDNSYFHVVLGAAGAPLAGPPVPSTGQLIVTGGQSATGASWTWFRFGESGSTSQFVYTRDVAETPIYTAGPSTVCLDLGQGAAGNARLLFWATGAGGADCADLASLTEANALYDSDTDPTTGGIWAAPLSDGATYFRANNPATLSVGEVMVLSEAVVL